MPFAKKGKVLKLVTNRLLSNTDPKKLCNNLPMVILLENSLVHCRIKISSNCLRLIAFFKKRSIQPAANLLVCKAMLIPFPHNGAIIPAESPIINKLFSINAFFPKFICEIVRGDSKRKSLQEK